jgi:minor extracellular serine protease Vpr
MNTKLYYLLLTLLFLGYSQKSFSQNFEELKKTGKPSDPTFVYERPQNCALNTSFLMMDLKQNKDIDYLKNRYSLNEIDNILYVGAFLKVDKETFQKKNVESLGVKLNTEAGNFFTALIPINNLESLFTVEGIISVEIAEKVHTTMDNARTLTNVNQVQAGTGLPQAYTGNGVVIGVIDRGFDYTHPNFRNLNTQLTRISKVWEQSGVTTAPAPFGYGTDYIGQTAILNRMRDKIDESHGTHVAGIAAGSGGIANSVFKGVAYDSEIVLVSSGTNQGALDGISYIFQQASLQGKAAVINISQGSHIGPHDGTSNFDSMCNNLVGPGRILVGACGNEGSANIHLSKTFSSTNNICYSFIDNFSQNNLNTNGVSVIDVWGEVGKNFDISVNVVKIVNNQVQLISFTPYYSTTVNNPNIVTTLQDSDTTNPVDVTQIAVTTETNSINQKPHASIFINNSTQDDNNHYILFEIKSSNGTVNSWITALNPDLTPSNRPVKFTNFSSTNTLYVNGDTNMTVGEVGGTGNSIISVGAFNSKSCTTMFLNNNNIKCTFDVNTDLFKIADFSSKGPTVDGRIKPDITAPGNRIVSSISRFDSRYDFQGGTFNQYANYADVVSGLTSGTNTWRFAAMQGTSMSSPMVAGIIALWLQAKPNLTVAQIKTILQSTSITDSDTGTGSAIPNNTWGRGKINALAGMLNINQFLNVDTFDNSNNFVVYPNPTNSKIYITSKDYVGAYEIINTLGQKVSEGIFNSVLDEKELDLSSLQSGLYILNFKGMNSYKSIRIIKQ